MAKKEFTKTTKLLLYLATLEDLIIPMADIHEFRKRFLFGSRGSLNSTIYRLHQRGWIRVVDKNAQRFLKLTAKGELEVLLAKAFLPPSMDWDGKWRMLIFDIPEESKDKRNFLRALLKNNNFFRLQNSVYVNPYPLNREALVYLKQSKLSTYIRIIKVQEIDDDTDLRKHFSLPK